MAVKICTGCGESNSEGALLCVVCGSSLKDAQVKGDANAAEFYTRTPEPVICQHCNERLEQGSLSCKYCGTVISTKAISPRYDTDRTAPNGEERERSTSMETFGRGCLWLILGSLGLLIFAFITQSTINIPWFIFIPIVIFVFWMASKKSGK